MASLLVSPIAATASAPPGGDQLIICASLKTGATFISKTGLCNPRIYEARTWHKLGTAPLGTPGSAPIDLVTCQSKGSTTQIIRSRTACNRTTQNTARWQRPLGPAAAPAISSVVMGLLGTATLRIEPPVNDGGSRITSYIVTTNPGGVTTTFTPAQIKAAQITGLKPGTTYSFSTVAVNAKSPSPLSIVTTPALAPTTAGMPTITSVVATGTNTALLTFTAPSDNGGSPITSYVVTAMPGGLRTTVSQAGGGTISISNLSPSTNYTFTITAINAAGASSAAPAPLTITTATPPPPPEPVAVAPPAPVDTIISIAAIAGVTAPVTGATPITATTAGTGYTGTVTWSGSPSTFAAATTYTATITLTATSGYTLTGVTANFFTVVGATTVTHSANSGVITAVFPATAIAAPAFTLSASSETRTVNTVATGFTINSTGDANSSFTISPAAPAGMSFNTTTGVFTGTPTSVAAATTYVVTGTNATGSTSQSFNFTVLAGPATAAAITTQPTGAASGSTLATQPVIRIVDAGGNTVSSSTVNVVVSIASGGGSLSGQTTVAAVNGVATFTNLVITGTPGNRTLTFTPTSLTAVTSNTVTITSRVYQVGDTGPGGGIVFYVAPSTFTQIGASGSMCTTTCKYLEAAPSGWSSVGAPDPLITWSTGTNQTTSVSTAVGIAIGTGYENSGEIKKQSGNVAATSAAVAARSYAPIVAGITYTDWFLPSKDELNELIKQFKISNNYGMNTTGSAYWSSSQSHFNRAWAQGSSNEFIQFELSKSTGVAAKAIRAFG